jgi:hypothetical protein
MPTVIVKYKLVHKGSSTTTSRAVQVTKRPPTESEVSAQLKKAHPKEEFVILEIK